jgi:hypothetical protein
MKSLSAHIKLAAGTEQVWERVEIFSAGNTVVTILDKNIVNSDSVGELS